MRTSVFALLYVPGLVYPGRFALRDVGPRPLHEALLVAASVELRRLFLTRHADRQWCGVLGVTALGLGDATYPDSLAGASITACVGIPALLGVLREDWPGHG